MVAKHSCARTAERSRPVGGSAGLHLVHPLSRMTCDTISWQHEARTATFEGLFVDMYLLYRTAQTCERSSEITVSYTRGVLCCFGKDVLERSVERDSASIRRVHGH